MIIKQLLNKKSDMWSIDRLSINEKITLENEVFKIIGIGVKMSRHGIYQNELYIIFNKNSVICKSKNGCLINLKLIK